MLLGAGASTVVLVAVGALILRLGAGGPKEQHHRSLRLASGHSLEVTSLYLAFGDEHTGRGAIDDGVCVEYVTEDGASDKEAAEVFEAVRPVAEALGVGSASVSAFRSLVRKGHYERHDYARDAAGTWTSRSVAAKVFAND
jgi:hypothetical protein